MDYYKKKYDEALERARKLKENPQSVFNEYSPKEGDTICDYIFPELCESEDEKIRKELIEHVKDQQSSFISAPDCRDKYEEEENDKYNSWLAWLEEQSEQKPTDKVEPKFKIGDYIERKDGVGCHAKIIFVGGNFYGCEKLIYPEDSSPFFEFMFENQDEFRMSSDFQQKPAWSEEDEKMFRNLNSLIYVVRDCDCDSKEKLKLSVWLKSLKEKCAWKPSDEQLEALDSATENCAYSEYQDCLRELLKQLKKLKEE